jgi:hypothetical protein
MFGKRASSFPQKWIYCTKESEVRPPAARGREIRRQFCSVIDILLEDGPILERAAAATELIKQIQAHDQQFVPDDILDQAIDILTWISEAIQANADARKTATEFTREQEMILTNKLFELYADVNEGALIFWMIE